MGSRSATPPSDLASPDSGMRKRVCKACDRCRLKKSKCDGSSPCSRCKADNAICVFGERKKSHDKVYPKGYVEMLESQQAQLVAGLQELYRRLQTGEGWTGAPLKECGKGAPLTHEILERLGALKHDNQYLDEGFEENFDILQHRLIANGSGFMQRGASFDTNSDAGQSPIFEPVMHHKTNHFTNPWTMSHLPPTPPTISPRPSLVKTSSPLKSQIPTPVSHHSEQSPIFMEPSELNDGMDFSLSYQPSDFDIQATPTFYDPNPMIINPNLTMKDGWQSHDDFIPQYYTGGSFA